MKFNWRKKWQRQRMSGQRPVQHRLVFAFRGRQGLELRRIYYDYSNIGNLFRPLTYQWQSLGYVQFTTRQRLSMTKSIGYDCMSLEWSVTSLCLGVTRYVTWPVTLSRSLSRSKFLNVWPRPAMFSSSVQFKVWTFPSHFCPACYQLGQKKVFLCAVIFIVMIT